MIRDTLRVVNDGGLHARSARTLVDALQDFDANIRFVNDEVEARADSVMELMMLSAPPGTQLEVILEGPDEAEAHEALVTLFERGFYEDE